MKKYVVMCCVLATALQSCKNDSKKAVTEPNDKVKEITENYHQERLKLYPWEATTAGDDRYNNLMPNTLDDAYIKQTKDFFTKYKEQIASVKDEDLSENDLISKQLLLWECNINLERYAFKEELMPVNQFWSVILTTAQFASGQSMQPFKTVKDYNNWLERLESFKLWLASAQQRMKEGVTKGYVLPKALTVKVIPQLKDMTVSDVKTHLFYSPINTFPDTFTDAEKKELTDKYTKIISEKLIPSFTSLYNYVSTDYLAASRSTSGISALPNGDKYYQYLIKLYTTTDMTADEIHKLGLKEVERISAEMEKIKNQVGFKGTLKEFFNYVRTKKELMPFTKPEQVIAHYNGIYDRMKPNLDKIFDLKPKAGFEVRRTEAFREASASAEYNQPSLDGSRPGIFYVPLPDVTKYNTYDNESLFLHEAIPGHHYQIALQQENTSLPSFRKTIWFTVYGEGWALYAESLGKELGLYTDPYQYFGTLSLEIHRAIRLVVDTGLHTKGWTREQAIQYSLDHEAEGEESIIAEIERYMAIPGQALAYKIGQLKIRELRTKAEKELGDKFSIKEYHNQVLDAGCLPIKVFEDKINRWIEGKK
ncbi:DUF885 family protein [Flavobacterium sp. Sd200]|uniref:DUF885 domain-containing protein n=1 Tax=Flavobacterium sp. Sd200 TaxID=2692211 RepID=UPI0013708F35|nr:DUF885 domain-containing protein [Flavobacterium sp. Sd200]MXN92279.1 DUF885 family protein [Flavobacterium sp. Sd200]